MRRAAAAVGWATMVLFVGCEQPRTELVVRVDSEVAWGPGQRVQSVVLSVRRGGTTGPLRSARTSALSGGAERRTLPLYVGVLAGDDDTDTPVWIEALGCGGPNGCTPMTAVVAQRAIVRFVRGQTQELPLLLASACVGVTCGSDEGCAASGRCEPATRAQAEVRPFTGTVVPVSEDAMVAMDVVAADVPVVMDTPVAIDGGTPVDQLALTDVAKDVGPDVASSPDTTVPPDVSSIGDAGADAAADARVDGGAVVTPPRPVAPLSTATVARRQPTLHWRLAPGTDGAHVEVCRDRACGTVEQRFDVTGDHGVPSAELTLGIHFWRLFGRSGTTVGTAASPTWEFVVGRRSAPINTSWGTVADFNGDGYADLVVGALNASGNTGRVHVYLGSATGLPTSPRVSLSGPDGTGGAFGRSVASAGDVNGDGYADLVVGAPNASSITGRAHVYLGSAQGERI